MKTRKTKIKLRITLITKFVATFHQLHRTKICHCNGKFGLEFQFQFPVYM
jgi:hypothetical protein